MSRRWRLEVVRQRRIRLRRRSWSGLVGRLLFCAVPVGAFNVPERLSDRMEQREASAPNRLILARLTA